MNFLLKIVEGPNKGAEVALVEGVDITLGKSDACDIVLADATLGDEPLKLAVASDSVTLDGEPLQPFYVVTRGATAFAVGPANSAWGELVWPKREEPPREEKTDAENEHQSEPSAAPAPRPAKEETEEAPKQRKGCFGCLSVIFVLLLILLGLGWYFREQLKPYAETALSSLTETLKTQAGDSKVGENQPVNVTGELTATIEELVARHGLSVTNRKGRVLLVGDFATRSERLAATAEAYAAQPGIALDFADNESLKGSVADTLTLVGETQLTVSTVTNRVAVLTGGVRNIRRTLEALATDVPKLANVDVAGIVVKATTVQPSSDQTEIIQSPSVEPSNLPKVEPSNPPPAIPELPVCGILTMPYPCLVLRDGRRVLEGAPIGDYVVLKINSDSVILTNDIGRIEWKP